MSQTYRTAKADFVEAWRATQFARVAYEQKWQAWYAQGAFYYTQLYDEMRAARMASEYAQARFIDCAETYAVEVIREAEE